MVDSQPPQNLALNPSETAYCFPPHRRRPIRSRTYGALIEILPLCCPSYSHLKLQVDSGEFESESVSKEDGSSTGNENSLQPVSKEDGSSTGNENSLQPVSKEDGSSTRNEPNSDVIVPLPNSKCSNDSIVQEDSNDEKKENTDKQATNLKLHHINSVADGQQETCSSNGISFEDLVIENQTGDCAIQSAKEQENLKSVLDIQVDDFEVYKEFCIGHFNESLEACFGMDMDIESSKGGDSQEKGAILENIPKDAEHELKLKEIELEKLIHNSGGMESSFHLNADEEMEEGEISGEAGVAGGSFDDLSNDAASVGERTTEKMHSSENYFDSEEPFCKDKDRGRLQHETSDPLLVNIVNSDRSSMKMESRTPAKQMKDCFSQSVLYDNHTETQRRDAVTPCLESLTPHGRILQGNAAENQISCTTEKDASKKKRKRGQGSKETKKIKRRLKRAEKNRKLGVKRLKLQPVLKPKTVVYCRHYLQGKCHEGDKCNFSHDTVPLTKSKPCCHFARHSCMKGDDCPFDHELSKYPCNNFASNGSCSRGSECLFSHAIPENNCSITPNPNASKPDLMAAKHTVPDKGGSNPVSKVTKPEMKFLSPLNNSNSSKHMDNHSVLNQKVDPKLCSASNSPGQSAELVAAKPVARTGHQPPKGVSFLLNKGMLLGDTNKEKHGGSSTTTPDGGGVGCNKVLKGPGGISKLNEMSEVAAPRKPKGVNFLSFGQPSADNSSSKIFSNFLTNSNEGTGKSVIGDSDGRNLKINGQMNPSATNLASDLNEEVNGTLLTVPQLVNFSTIYRTRLDDSISKRTANLHSSKGEERPNTSMLQDTVRMPSLSFGGIWNQSTSGQNANLSSSFKRSLLSNTPSSVQKAVQSTLAFAAKLEPDIKVGSSLHQ